MSEAPATSEPGHRYRVHVGLFLATCVTTFLAGAGFGGSMSVESGLAFSATLMGILVCHEMGHYVVARRHGIDASLPYFIPLPPGISLGTMGAVIRMRQPITDRNQLIDVGAAGPLAGLCAAIPLLAYGLSLSEVELVEEPGLLEGNSLLYIAIKYLVHGRYLPAPDGTDVLLHPIAWASWVGLLITFINLIPIGQLDGGHVARAFLGDRHEALSAWLHRGLLLVGVSVVALLAASARRFGLPWDDAFLHGLWAGMPWLAWAAILLLMRRLSGGVYHPPVGEEPLTRGRHVLLWSMAVVFVLVFTPVPLREILIAPAPQSAEPISAPALWGETPPTPPAP
jgi:membrane-associated protease RseP (regulator of RpoE activity)